MPDPCPYCGKMMDGRRPLHATYKTRDHVIPQSLGGERTVYCCRRCNMDKGSTPIQVWQAILDRRKDPRAWHVSAFICANPWAVSTVLLADASIAPKLPHLTPRGSLAFDPLAIGKAWRCLECARRFYSKEAGERHWRDLHSSIGAFT